MSYTFLALLGLILGVIMVCIVSFRLLKKREFEPGVLSDHYFVKDHTTPIMRIILGLSGCLVILNILVALTPFAVMGATVMLTIYASYIFYSYFLDRKGLVSTTYVVFAVAALASPLLPGYLGLSAFVVSVFVLLECDRRYKEGYKVRYARWAKTRAARLTKRFAHLYAQEEKGLQDLILTVMMVEDVARPSSIRFLERCYASIFRSKSVSTGIMQIRHKTPLSDNESVERGIEMLRNVYKWSPEEAKDKNLLFRRAAFMYNGHPSYATFMDYFYEYAKRANDTRK